jgi:hypothetical protein
MRNYILILLLLFCVKINAQNIQGKVIDEITGATVPFVSINLIGTNTTTVTNENGDFIIKVPALPAKLRFSHVSYLTAEVSIDQRENNLLVKFKPAAINLKEVSIDPNRGLKLLKQALELANRYKLEDYFFNAFYRQLSTIDNNPSQIHEIFYDLRWNVNATDGWIAKQTRFADRKDRIKFSLNNQSYFTFISSGYLIDNKKNAFINLKNLEKYTVEIENYIEQANQDIAVISCKLKKPRKNQYYTNSKYYIGVDDGKVYKLENSIFNLPLSFDGGIDLKFPPIATTISTFKNTGGPITVLESVATKMYLSLNFAWPLNLQDVRFNVNSLLTILNEDENIKANNFSAINKNVKDQNVIESVKYNADFWKNNPVVKQTALEDKFIKMMESQNAFGTMINP